MWDLMCQKIITINQFPAYNSINHLYQMSQDSYFLATNTHVRFAQVQHSRHTWDVYQAFTHRQYVQSVPDYTI